jgi:cobalt-zinc-cadmium efflux system protein
VGHHHHHHHSHSAVGPHTGHAHGHTHAHDGHGHSHGDARSALGLALGLNALFLGVEVGVGLWTGSLALLSDAAHMLSDVGALALALGAAQLARRRASSGMTFGLARAEVLGAFVNGLGLLAVCAAIANESVRRLFEGPPPVAGAPVMVVGAIGLAINLASAWVLHRADHDDLNVRGALLHMLSDALGSAAAIVAAVALMYGVTAADPVVSLLVGALVAVGAVGLVRDAGRILLELPPRGLDVGRLHTELGAIDGVAEVHDLHAWSLDGRTPLVSAHIVVDAEADADGVCARARSLLDDGFGVHHATLQVEGPRGDCGVRCDVS